jgi:pimeloyl-ACP methyl ester carboxylesterase
MHANGIRLHYDVHGTGDPVVMVMGSAAKGHVWNEYQIPALTENGFQAVTFDHRGLPPTDECVEGFTFDDLVRDTVSLVEELGLGPVRLVGTSLGARICQELMLTRPDLVSGAVLMATRGRADVMGLAMAAAERELHDSGMRPPPRYAAMVKALQNLSPATLAQSGPASDWLDILAMGAPPGRGARTHMEFAEMPDRLPAYRDIQRPCLVVAFADDRINPPHLGREVAKSIPGAEFEVIEDCGHYGYLEAPDQVNERIIQFLRKGV